MKDTRRAVILEATSGGFFGQSLQRGFELDRWTVDLVSYSPLPVRHRSRRVASRMFDPRGHSALRRAFNAKLFEILPNLHLSAEDILLVLRGEDLDSENRVRLEGGPGTLIGWASDSLERCPGQVSVLQVAERRFYIDEGDIPVNSHRSGIDRWLPLGYDDSFYTPSREKRDIDVLVVGRLGPRYAQRRAYLDVLVRSSLPSHFRCAYVGPVARQRSGSRGRLSLGSVEWLASWLPQDELGKLIARSKICVNIHQDDGARPVNPMFFAIPGCGTCQISNDSEWLRTWLRDGADYIGVSISNFVEVLTDLLGDPTRHSAIGSQGYNSVRRCHTFRNRVQTILGSSA